MKKIIHANNINYLRTLKDNSVDSVVTDPPYGISFMGKKWDYDVPSVETWKEVLRVLKPGGHMLVACGTRTQHRMAVNIEDAGFEIRDIVAWVYGSGFPKSMDISKALDKHLGAEREVIGKGKSGKTSHAFQSEETTTAGEYDLTKPSTEQAKQWQGWGTALKPAMELWTMARKPLIGTVAENVLKHGVGGINIDESRIPFGDETDSRVGTETKRGDSLKYEYHGIDFEVLKRYENDEDYVWSENLKLSEINVDNINEFLDGINMVGYQFQFDLTQYEEIIIDTHLKHIIPVVDTFKNKLNSNSMFGVSDKGVQMYKSDGRFPANFVHDGSEEVVSLFPYSKAGEYKGEGTKSGGIWSKSTGQPAGREYGDSGSASRFFYVAKASQEERNFGLYDFDSDVTTDGRTKPIDNAFNRGKTKRKTKRKNIHPTVKPIELMRYLVRMITPPNGICLDPYLGSGTTAIACEMEKFNYIGIELDEQYVEIAKARVGAVKDYDASLDTKTIIKESIKEDKEKELGIMDIFDFIKEKENDKK
jgi:site-specific DNA-methyltransferase (adenine-specific)